MELATLEPGYSREMKLATWNVALPVSSKRRAAMRAHTDREQADVWVLTETHDGFTPGCAFSHSSAAGRDGHHLAEHRWVTIWSQHPIEPLEISDEERTAAVRVSPEGDNPFVVFGTVLPWIGSEWRGHPSAAAFQAALAVQAQDWTRIRRDYSRDEFFVLGDLNQTLVSSPSYGSRANRSALEAALAAAGLTVLTAGDSDPVRRDSAPRASVDHICAQVDSTWRAEPAVRWPDAPVPERRLSDHFGVSVALSRT